MQKDNEKLFYQILLFIAAVLLAFMFYRLQRQGNLPPAENKVHEKQALQVKATPIVGQDKTISKKYIGYVIPINQVDVIPYISGFIEKIDVISGKEIQAGEHLIKIKPDEYIAAKNAAEAAVLKTKAILENAKIYYERMEKTGEKSLSKTEIDNARAAYLEAEAAYSGAKADLQSAEVTLGYTDIISSISGIVGYVDLSVGDYISPNKSLFRIIQSDPIRIVFSISDNDYLQENDKSHLFAEDVIKLELSDGHIYDKIGRFAFFDNQLNTATNSLAVYADFDNPNKVLIANSYVNIIIEKTLKNTISIEKKLLIMQPDGNFVFVIRDGKAALQKVEIISDDSSYYIVHNNFAPHDLLITDINNAIKEGLELIPDFQTDKEIK